jgi:hypothetical protein
MNTSEIVNALEAILTSLGSGLFSPLPVRRAVAEERALIARLEAEPESRTTDVCPVCEAPGVTVQNRDGTAHFERAEPNVLAEGRFKDVLYQLMYGQAYDPSRHVLIVEVP